ncbi:hypothetical protein V6Z11_D11G263800 [Gossypium hirsutum]
MQISVKKILVNFRQWYRWAKPLLTSKILGACGSSCVFTIRCVIAPLQP